MDPITPNLFVLGAARCGTTSLHAILGQHPEIHTSKIKEPTFFNWPCQVVRNPVNYFRLFESSRRYRMEASVTYFTSPETAPILRGLFPNARFIVSLRDPKARAYSLYRYMRARGLEDIATFAEALKAEPGRYTSPEFLKTLEWDVWLFFYCRSSQYDSHLARYFSLFDREQFHVITLAELSKDPLSTTKGILEFLDLDPSPAKNFKFHILNRNVPDRSPYDVESERILTAELAGVMGRTEAIVERALDWSM